MKTGRRQVMEALSLAVNLGFALAINTIVGVFLGRMLDEWLGAAPWGVALGALFGLLAGLRSIYSRAAAILGSGGEESDKDNDNGKEN